MNELETCKEREIKRERERERTREREREKEGEGGGVGEVNPFQRHHKLSDCSC